jgi:casein kinase I homolog HRR25
MKIEQFIDYMSYVKNLKFEEKPDYMYIRRMFKDLFY